MSRLNFLRTTALALAVATLPAHADEHFAPYTPQHGHTKPVVAVIGHNAGTELTDFVIPYAVLQRSGAVETYAVATQPGAMTMRPALHLQPDLDTNTFDTRYPEGADYVIVPAVVHRDDPALLAWINQQNAKGATIVSICDGALVVAATGLLKGHRATAHWATESYRRKTYPEVTWVSNTRYIVDGRLASSAGISAAIPASLALLESIAGHDKALAVAAQFGVTSWTTQHNSDTFKPHMGNLVALAKTNATNKWFHSNEKLGLPLQDGMDDIAVALTADAWSRTGRSQAYGISPTQKVRSRSGLVWLSDSARPTDMQHAIAAVTASAGVPLFDAVLAAIEGRYGRSTAQGVAIDFEYPWAPAAE